MKTLFLGISGICVVGGIALYLSSARLGTRTPPQAPAVAGPTPEAASLRRAVVERSPLTSAGGKAAESETAQATTSARPVETSRAEPNSSLPVQHAVQTLLSPQASFAEKQAVWQQLKDSGKIDLAIDELEKGAASNPNAAEYPATLGQAYLQKAALLKDVREQGILGMKADQSFDTALGLDPANWDAGFWKATALSYWPPELNKGQEVLERFADLIKLQETQPSQPQFAQTYVLLGDQYQKQGYPDYAKQIWQRGAGLFPSDSKLAEKVSQPQPEQAAAH